MKKFYSILATVLITVTAWAQSPQKMSYQAVIRNTSGELVASHAIGILISILHDSPTGDLIYTEEQTSSTNENGLLSIEIGSLVPLSSIDWSDGPYYIKTDIDPTGGTSYTITATSQILSVPYALHAKTAASYAETDPVFTSHASSGITAGNITNWSTAYGWGDHSLAGYFANGGEAGGSDRTLGNSDDFSLGFRTNDETRMFIANDGKIGIGSATPNGYLEVTDKGDNTPYNLIVLGQTATPNRLRLSSGTNYGIISVGPSIDESKGLTIRHSSGYIGMGTSDPSTKLDVNGVITATGGNSTNWNNAFSWGNHATKGYFANGGEATHTNRTLGNNDDYSLGFKTGNATRLLISDWGNIGIGTIAPIYMLQIIETDDPYNGFDDDGDGLLDEHALDVTGRVRIADGSQGEGKVLTSDADGTAIWAAPGGGSTHYLGEEYNGGIIFYIYRGSDGLEHGLIVSKTETAAKWQNTEVLVNANRTEDGAYNTGVMTDSPAKTWVTGLGADWYLPSIDELSLLWHSRYHVNKTARAISSTLLYPDRQYSSSTEFDEWSAFTFPFDVGFANSGPKSINYFVRAVRAF